MKVLDLAAHLTLKGKRVLAGLPFGLSLLAYRRDSSYRGNMKSTCVTQMAKG